MPRRPSEQISPDLLRRVRALAMNLWWSWDPAPQRLFAALDPVRWDATDQNPIATLAGLSEPRIAELTRDAAFLEQLAESEGRLSAYLKTPTWFAGRKQGAMLVAYFSAEFAIHESLQQYAGGLGVLAGDHLKAASDLGVPLVGVGLLYRCGYYRQSFAPDGATRVTYPEYDFSLLPIENTGRQVRVPMGARSVLVNIWKAQAGRTALYLLDSDHPANRPADRGITRHLYGGDNETRIQQEIILGVGGVMALKELGLRPTVYHLNEGHAAFSALERYRQLRATSSAEKALQTVRASTVFTTHTPVPAGHDRFEPRLMKKYLGPHMGGDANEWLPLGREVEGDPTAPFCMTALALRLAERCNGVSKLHGAVSREMWRGLYGGLKESDVPIGSVTNGVHSPTWTATEARALVERRLKVKWQSLAPDANPWRDAGRIPLAEMWELRRRLRKRLVHFVRARLLVQAQRQCAGHDEIQAALHALDEDALTIGFARRFATYKRAPLAFLDAKRLSRILNDAQRPVQLIFAGKAHPKDMGGQEFAQRVYQLAHKNGLRGKVVILEDYDMRVGRELTSGCDVWLNNPIRPMEASGTSGMKPPLQGGLNCSILDGWWPEAYDGRNGWKIGDENVRAGAAQDRHDATSIYELLEKEIVPLFYRRDREGVPREWVKRMLRSMQTVCGAFSAARMVGEYTRDYYLPAHQAAVARRR